MRVTFFFVKPERGRLILLYSAVFLLIAVMLHISLFSPYPPKRSGFQGFGDIYTVTDTGTIPYIQDARADAYAADIGKCLVYINLDKLYLLVYKDGQQVRAFPCSGGKNATPSPYGQWKVISKDTWGDGFGGYWMGLNVPWGKYGIHGTSRPWYIGRYNASKGCIRLYSEDAKELYRLVPYGATIIIENENRPFRVIQNGMVGSDVRDVQIALKALNIYNSSLDGKYGDSMSKSVRTFQKQNRLPVTGTVDKTTYNLIMTLFNEVKEPLE